MLFKTSSSKDAQVKNTGLRSEWLLQEFAIHCILICIQLMMCHMSRGDAWSCAWNSSKRSGPYRGCWGVSMCCHLRACWCSKHLTVSDEMKCMQTADEREVSLGVGKQTNIVEFPPEKFVGWHPSFQTSAEPHQFSFSWSRRSFWKACHSAS